MSIFDRPYSEPQAPLAENNIAMAGIEAAYGPRAADNRAGKTAASPKDQPPSVPELIGTCMKLFDKLDANKDGYLERSELAKAVVDPAFKGREAMALAVLYHAQLQMYVGAGHWDNGVLGGFKISRADIKRFAQIEAEHPQKVAMTSRVFQGPNELTAFFDQHHSSPISSSDLKNLAKNPKLSAEERQVVQFLVGNFRHADSMPLNALIYAFEKHNDESIYRSVHDALDKGKVSISTGVHALYADADHALACIRPDAVKQGFIGDCYFEAALAEVAAIKPETIANMIKDNKNGTYTVTFPGASNEPITVVAPTDSEQYLYNGVSPYGTWASVVEKAYGTYCQQHFWRRNFLMNTTGGRTPTEGAEGGGWWGALELLTGNTAQVDDLGKTPASDVADHLNAALNGHPPRPVIVGTPSKGENSFVNGHMYSVLAFKPDGHHGGTVTVRNPWGRPDSSCDFSVDGTYDIPLDVYMRCFAKQATTTR